MTLKPVCLFDTECYPNFFLLKFKIGLNYYKVEVVNNVPLIQTHVDFVKSIFNNYTCVSFNGINYDIPMIIACLHHFNNDQLKKINDCIIVGGLKHWQLSLPQWCAKDHIDLMEVAPGKASLKQYAGRIHSKKIQDLPYNPDRVLTDKEMKEVDDYCGNDLDVLEDLWKSLQPQILQRINLSERYGLDLRSKSDAQLAEAVLKRRCERATCSKIYKSDINWDMQIKYEAPKCIEFNLPQTRLIFEKIKNAIFILDNNGKPTTIIDDEWLVIINNTTYKLGMGGIHSQEKSIYYKANDDYILIDNDVASYYPSLILNSGKWPDALGCTFLNEYKSILDERLVWKAKQKNLAKGSPEYIEAECGNEGGKIMINGTFGKTGSHYSVLFAPQMLLQTTLTGQLELLMLIELHEINGIEVVSANTDGIIIKCKRDDVWLSKFLIEYWEQLTNLKMESTEYKSIYSRDINNYFAVKTDGDVKRKGEFSHSGLIAKKNPDVEICSDAVANYLSSGVDIKSSIIECKDLRKFIVVQAVKGGAVKLWGIGADKKAKVVDMTSILIENGWVKVGRMWSQQGVVMSARDAYAACFPPQRREYLGKVARWYYSTQAPGTIVYANNGNTVSLSEGAKPCMILPESFPEDVDYDWYIRKAIDILKDVGVA